MAGTEELDQCRHGGEPQQEAEPPPGGAWRVAPEVEGGRDLGRDHPRPEGHGLDEEDESCDRGHHWFPVR